MGSGAPALERAGGSEQRQRGRQLGLFQPDDANIACAFGKAGIGLDGLFQLTEMPGSAGFRIA